MEAAAATVPSNLHNIPAEYLGSVVVQAYHLEISLAVEQATYSGLVRIPVYVSSGLHSVFYLHVASGMHLSTATVNDTPGLIVRDRLSPTHVTRIEVPEEAAVCGGTSVEIAVQFEGLISNGRTDGLYMIGTGCSKKSGAAEKSLEGLRVEQLGGGKIRGRAGKGGREKGGDGDKVAADSLRNNAADSVAGAASAGGCDVFPAEAVLGTHLEPTHARELFPCIDSPSAKAVFHLTLRGVPRHLQAISNTPVLRSEDMVATAAAATDGRTCCHPATKSVTFQATPVMPTYVFGFWVGDFHCISTRALATTPARRSSSTPLPLPLPSPLPRPQEEDNVVQINVHVVKGVSLEGAKFALGLARRAFELFSSLFSVRFPMPKLDLIGLPQMQGLGMENFGAITCLQEYLLVTAETSFVRRRRIARLICHEVSHMWYGDIVTPESFDELWLKEGMARFLEYLAVDSLDPSYRVWNNFMSEVFLQAMLADSQENTHSVVQQHNGDIASILESFDTITYCKGASVLRMLSHCVGPDRFLDGIGAFVVTHQYGCATQEDLWKAVQGVCDQAGIDLSVRELMQPWLTRPKFPVLRVRVAGSNLVITQQPFSYFAVPPRGGTANGVDPTIMATKVARRVCQVGAGEGTSEDAGARWPKLPRTGASVGQATGLRSPDPPAPGGRPREVSARVIDTDMQVSDAAAATGVAAATREKSEPEGVSQQPDRSPKLRGAGRRGDDTCWAVPLRIRMATGSQRLLPGSATSPAGQENGWKRCSGSDRGRPGEEMYRILLAERSTSVTLPSLSREPAGVPSAGGEIDRGTNYLSPPPPPPPPPPPGGVEGCDGGSGSHELYLVVNDAHSGFFTVQYECERSWALALAAVEEGALDECETMGFVHDLILPLHEGVMKDRRTASLSIAGRQESSCGGGGNFSCDVACLFSRLEKVVRLLGRDRGHPAWATGQLFIWELLIMRASNALREVYELSRTRSDSLEHNRNVSGATGSVVAVAGEKAGGGGESAGRGYAAAGATPQAPQGAESAACAPRMAPRMETSDGRQLASGKQRPTGGVVAAEVSAVAATTVARSVVMGDKTKAMAQRVRGVATEMKQALEEVEEHVRWHADLVASGMEQADEALQSLRSMRDRLGRSRAQLAWARRNGALETKA